MQKTAALPQDVLDLAAKLGIGERIFAIMDLTQEMFPGPVTAEAGYDPSWPEDRWITFVVKLTGGIRRFIEMPSRWCGELCRLMGASEHRFNLSFV